MHMINMILPVLPWWLNTIMMSAVVCGALYVTGWLAYQLDYLDWLDPQEYTSVAPHIDSDASNTEEASR